MLPDPCSSVETAHCCFGDDESISFGQGDIDVRLCDLVVQQITT